MFWSNMMRLSFCIWALVAVSFFTVGCDFFCLDESLVISTKEELKEAQWHTCVDGDVAIYNSDDIEFADLSRLKTIGTYLDVTFNSKLHYFDFSNVDNVRTVRIQNNDLLEKFAPFRKTGGYTDFYIENNPGLASLEGLKKLPDEYKGGMYIRNNDALENLNGLEHFVKITLRIDGNDSLVNLDELENIVSGSMYITGNTALESIEGLKSLQGASSLYIKGNDSLTSLKGLGNNYISSLVVEDNDSLVNFKGFGPCSGFIYLRIMGNSSLESLDGLENVREIESALSIENNPMLPYCKICTFIDQLDIQPIATDIGVVGNLTDECGNENATSYNDLSCPQ